MASQNSNHIQTIQAQQQERSNAFSLNGKSQFELAYMRRICIREQKLHLILRKLEQDLPVRYLNLHCLVLIVWTILATALQILLIVYKSPLYYICAGFWCSAFFILCAVLAILLGKIKFIFNNNL